MRKALRIFANILLVAILLAAAGIVLLDLTLLREGAAEARFIKGSKLGFTNMAFSSSVLVSPPGSLALVRRMAGTQAQLGDVVIYFHPQTAGLWIGEVSAGGEGLAITDARGSTLELNTALVCGRVERVWPRAYTVVRKIASPPGIALAVGVMLLLIVLPGLGGCREQPLSPSDEQIGTMFQSPGS